jgi:hypothetical protein
MMPAATKSDVEKKTPFKGVGFPEQAILTVKVLLAGCGTLGLLALLEWMAVS